MGRAALRRRRMLCERVARNGAPYRTEDGCDKAQPSIGNVVFQVDRDVPGAIRRRQVVDQPVEETPTSTSETKTVARNGDPPKKFGWGGRPFLAAAGHIPDATALKAQASEAFSGSVSCYFPLRHQ